MTPEQRNDLLKEYPETPKWIVERPLTLDEARQLMKLRREAFPKTTPKE